MINTSIKPLRYWVQKVLPLVYDDSLSYYELLNKVVDKLNEVVDTDNVLIEYTNSLDGRVTTIEATLSELTSGEYSKILERYISDAIKMVFFGLTDTGYFVAYIPESWEDITFNTTEYDIDVPIMQDYGHLVLSY